MLAGRRDGRKTNAAQSALREGSEWSRLASLEQVREMIKKSELHNTH